MPEVLSALLVETACPITPLPVFAALAMPLVSAQPSRFVGTGRSCFCYSKRIC
jgi:hypothetical protein